MKRKHDSLRYPRPSIVFVLIVRFTNSLPVYSSPGAQYAYNFTLISRKVTLPGKSEPTIEQANETKRLSAKLPSSCLPPPDGPSTRMTDRDETWQWKRASERRRKNENESGVIWIFPRTFRPRSIDTAFITFSSFIEVSLQMNAVSYIRRHHKAFHARKSVRRQPFLFTSALSPLTPPPY